jgi:DNA-binding CsgD family transcriptional regulator
MQGRPLEGKVRMRDEVVGREVQLAAVFRFLDAVPAGPCTLLIEGEAGIGKTTVWAEGLEEARRRAYWVLATRPSQSEAKLSFTALSDLTEVVLDLVHEEIPAPQRHAMEVALLRSRPQSGLFDRRAISAAFLGMVRALSLRGPVVLAIDDLQWLDAPSARAVEFAVRRLEHEPVGLLASARAGGAGAPFGLDVAVAHRGPERLEIGPLSLGAIRRVVRHRIGSELSRPTMRRLHEAAGGNPFYALELARVLKQRGTEPRPGEPLPIPDDLRELVRERLDGLPASVLETLLAASAVSLPTVDLLRQAARSAHSGERALRRAAASGVIEIEGDRVRFTHPLLASACYARALPDERRQAHRRIAEIVTDPEERARHIALATELPDERAAATVETAATFARARGAPDAGAELCDLAAALTPPGQAEDLWRRRIDAAQCLYEAGDTVLALGRLQEAAAHAPAGRSRARALFLLARPRYHEEGIPAALALEQEALGQAEDDPALRSAIERDLAAIGLYSGDLLGGAGHAQLALDLAEGTGSEALVAQALTVKAGFEFFLGGGIPTRLMERALDLEGWTQDSVVLFRPSFMDGVILAVAGDLDGARQRLQASLALALASGDETSPSEVLFFLSQVEWRAGNLEAASAYVKEAEATAVQTDRAPSRSFALSASALVHGLLGDVDAARTAAEEGLAIAERGAHTMAMILNRSALAFLELSAGRAAGVDGHVGPVAQLALAGFGEPGVLRFLPDEIEALVGLGVLDDAQALLEPFEERARAVDRAWALATGARCRGLLLAARGDPPGALQALEEALGHHERMAEPFELGRTLLVKGRVERRAKRKREAKDSLSRALAIFNSLPAPLWADQAVAELRRVGLRPPAPLALTETERRTAELAASGLTNRQMADALFVSPKTVEANLARAYRKLGVSSRGELGVAMAEAGLRREHTAQT